MAQVTRVALPCGSNRKLTVLWALNGLNMSRIIVMLDGVESAMASRPLPTLRSPSHSYTAPLPCGAPLCVRFMLGSFSKGDQEVWACRSLISGKIFSTGALMAVARWTPKEFGLLAA